MVYINSPEINSKIIEVLGDNERYKITFLMSASEEFSTQKPKIQPFFSVNSDTKDVYKGIITLVISNIGASSGIITGIRYKIDRIKETVVSSIQNNRSVEFNFGGGLVRKKYTSFRIISSLKNLKSILSQRNFSIIIDVKVTNM